MNFFLVTSIESLGLEGGFCGPCTTCGSKVYYCDIADDQKVKYIKGGWGAGVVLLSVVAERSEAFYTAD